MYFYEYRRYLVEQDKEPMANPLPSVIELSMGLTLFWDVLDLGGTRIMAVDDMLPDLDEQDIA